MHCFVSASATSLGFDLKVVETLPPVYETCIVSPSVFRHMLVAIFITMHRTSQSRSQRLQISWSKAVVKIRQEEEADFHEVIALLK